MGRWRRGKEGWGQFGDDKQQEDFGSLYCLQRVLFCTSSLGRKKKLTLWNGSWTVVVAMNMFDGFIKGVKIYFSKFSRRHSSDILKDTLKSLFARCMNPSNIFISSHLAHLLPFPLTS